LDDADSVPRYVGKGRGRRSSFHEAKVRALLANPKTKRATRVHRAMLNDGRKFNPEIVRKELTQREAYDLEADLIRRYRRISEGGTLWNILSGNPGWNGILHDDWREVAARAVQTKGKAGLRRAGRKAAATKGPEGHKIASAKAHATRRANRRRNQPSLFPG